MTPAATQSARSSGEAQPGRSASLAKVRFYASDVGILPLMLAMPFMYYPKVLDGDTQPWILIAATVALFTFRTKRFLLTEDAPIIFLAVLCALVYAARGGGGSDLLRACYTQFAFIVLWVVCSRSNGEFFPTAVRLTIVVWLAAGAYQYLSIALGLSIDFAGRFVEGRGGVPSLASEPSTYGSLSILHMMYLLSEGKSKNRPYIVAAAVSVVLSGSLLALALLAFPLMKLKAPIRIVALLVIPVLIFAEYLYSSAGVSSRLVSLGVDESGFAGIVLDSSLNLRIGHIYFTFYENFLQSVFMTLPLDFMNQYNSFALNSAIFVETGSNFILTAAGELIYGSGFVGAALLYLFIREALAGVATRTARIEKAAFILACMLNPISMSNVFLVIYARQKGGDSR